MKFYLAGERESEKTISKVESPVKDLEQPLKDESIRRDAPHPSAVTDFGQLKPKPDKKIFGILPIYKFCILYNKLLLITFIQIIIYI